LAATLLARATRHLFVWVVVGVFAVLVAANLNGSSLGAYQVPGVPDSSLLHGHPRPVRSDEWRTTTPIQIGVTRAGFPSKPYLGLTRTEQLAVTQAGPRHHPLELFRPQDWGFFVLGAHRGFAVHWWFPYLISLLGLYALSIRLALGRAIAAGVAVVLTMAPYDAWWTAPTPGLFVGFGSLAAVAVLNGCWAGRTRAAVSWGAAGGAALIAMSLLLYPPWQIPVMVVLGALVVGQLLDRRPTRGRFLCTAAGGVGVSAVGLGWWYVTAHDAIRATQATIYPGHRFARAGQATLAHMLDAPLNPVLSRSAGRTLGPTTNLSEIASSWIPLPLLAAALLSSALWWWHRRSPGVGDGAPVGMWTAIALQMALGYLLIWALLPLPGWAGARLLRRAVPTRAPLAIGLGSVLLLAVLGRHAPRKASPTVGWALGGTATVWATWLAARHLPWDRHAVGTAHVVLLALLPALGFALLGAGRLPRVTAAGMAVYSLW
jgi:hypothetical protein